MSFISYGEYKGHPTITVEFDTERGPQRLTMGVAKAQAILENLNAYQEFVKRFGRNENLGPSTDGSDVT